jgi:hypothetical protein
MPETLWESINREELRNLAAFLAAPPPAGSGSGQ